MRFNVVSSSGTGLEVIELVHKDQVINWPVGGYKTAAVQNREGFFDLVNGQLERLPEKDQESLFQTYSSIRELLDLEPDANTTYNMLAMAVNYIYSILTYEECRLFCFSTCRFPTNLKSGLSEGDIPARTYLREDYRELVVLAHAIRFMVPIWGSYLTVVASQRGNSYKETICFSLLNGSSIVNWSAMERLKEYVEVSLNTEKSTLSTLLGGLSSSEIPGYMLALAVVRKLACFEYSSEESGEPLIRAIYNFVDGNATRLDVRFSGNVFDKRELSESSSEDDNSSVWDTYKVNQEISDGDLCLIEAYIEDFDVLTEAVCGDVDPAVIKSCYGVIDQLCVQEVEFHQLAITTWVVSQCIPPKGVMLLPKVGLAKCMVVTAALLWQRGFYELAAMMFSTRIPTDEDVFVGFDQRVRLDKSLVDRLNVLYPHYKRKGRKEDLRKQENIAVNSIERIALSVSRDQWFFNGPSELKTHYGRIGVDNTFSVSSALKNDLASLILNLFE